MTGTLVTTYYVMDVVFYLWYYWLMFPFLSFKSHSFGKVFNCSFFVTMRKVIFDGRVSEGHGGDGAL
jgi:hypothetical protein